MKESHNDFTYCSKKYTKPEDLTECFISKNQEFQKHLDTTKATCNIKDQPNHPLPSKKAAIQALGRLQKSISSLHSLIQTYHNKPIPKNKHRGKGKWLGRDICDASPEQVLKSLSSCLGKLDVMTAKMDTKYLECLEKSKDGKGVSKCIQDVEDFIDDLQTYTEKNPHCEYIHCLPKDQQPKMTRGPSSDSIQALSKYIISLDNYSTSMNLDYAKCLHQKDKSPEQYDKCIKTLSQDMQNFENVLDEASQVRVFEVNPPFGLVNPSGEVAVINPLLEQCNESVSIISKSLQTTPMCGAFTLDSSNSNTVEGCLFKVARLEDHVNACVSAQNRKDRGDRLKKCKKDTKKEKLQAAKALVAQEKAKKAKKMKAMCDKCDKHTPTGKITDCHEKCHPYDPLKDVYNTHYNFDKLCHHALGPIEGCDPTLSLIHI